MKENSTKKLAKEISSWLETNEGVESLERSLRQIEEQTIRLQEARNITLEMWNDPVTI